MNAGSGNLLDDAVEQRYFGQSIAQERKGRRFNSCLFKAFGIEAQEYSRFSSCCSF